jgi:very-short-patch-repair endonuclease
MRTELPPDLQRLADWQHGVLTRCQAERGGLTRSAIRARLSQNSWQRLYPGVYATFSGPLPRTAALWAAVQRAGPGAMLSYATAAEVGGLVDGQSELIHVTLPPSRRVSRIPGMVVHISELADQKRHPVLTPPQTRIEDTVLDLAGAATRLDDAYNWIIRALGRRLTTQDKLRASMDQRGRMRWRADLAEALSADQAGIHSALEHRYARDVERAHFLPPGTRQAPVKRGQRTEYRDVLYEGYGVAIELDGRAAHPGDTRWRDIYRDNAAAADGIVTLRYGWLDIRQRPCQVAAQVVQALRQRGYHHSRPCCPSCQVMAA